MRVNDLQSPEETKKKKKPKLALKLIKGHKLYIKFIFIFTGTFGIY